MVTMSSAWDLPDLMAHNLLFLIPWFWNTTYGQELEFIPFDIRATVTIHYNYLCDGIVLKML